MLQLRWHHLQLRRWCLQRWHLWHWCRLPLKMQKQELRSVSSACEGMWLLPSQLQAPVQRQLAHCWPLHRVLLGKTGASACSTPGP